MERRKFLSLVGLTPLLQLQSNFVFKNFVSKPKSNGAITMEVLRRGANLNVCGLPYYYVNDSTGGWLGIRRREKCK